MEQKICIIIAGPTASGKTDIAIDIAKHFQTEIISADSRQCFKELNIGVAKPSHDQLAEIPHHFINSHSVTDYFSAADYEKYALHAVENIFRKRDVAVMCGGTGLYIKAFCDGLDDIPEPDEEVKNTIAENYTENGIEWLQKSIQSEDLFFWNNGENKNPHRLMRALEVIRTTGKSVLSYQQKTKKDRDFKIVKIGLDTPRDILYERINARAEEMQMKGLEEEARKLFPYKDLNALQTVGYKELFEYFENKISKEKAFDLIKQNTRHYAKRQMTWFKKDPDIIWAAPVKAAELIIKILHQQLP